jgi:hypothetical protein
MKTKNITKEQEMEVIRLRERKWKGKDIAEKVGITLYQVYEVYKRYHITHKNNMLFILNSHQEQIILSGILGDGRLKKNGKYGYYYSECHALGEKEYCKWKFDHLGSLTEGHKIYLKNANNKYSTAVEFTTVTTRTLETYANMSIEEVIDNLEIIGFILFLLDDGWIRKDTQQFCISSGSLTEEQLKLFCLKCEYIGIHDVHITGRKRRDISIPKCNNEFIIKNTFMLFNKNIDIIKKKFYFVFEEES